MKKTNLKVKAISLLLASSQLGMIAAPAFASSAPSLRTIQGVVDLAGPVSHATIRVLDAHGRTLLTQNDATNESGYFSVTVPDGERAARVEAQASSLDGTLRSDLSGRERLLHLNVITTVSALYREKNPALSTAQADQRTLAYLGLPGLLDTGFSVENPYLRSFSANTLAQAAALNGGMDRYLHSLADEMQNPQATRAFPSQGLQAGNPAFWIGEKLLAGVVGAIGSQLFSKFMDGIGFPDQTTQIFNLLNQVMAQLAEIQNQLSKVEQAIKQANYDVRASALWKDYQRYVTLSNQIKETNLIANANVDAQGKIKDPKIAKAVKEAGESYVKELMGLGLSFISNVHAEFTSEGTITPLQKVFAETRFMDNNVIDKAYVDLVRNQLDQYRAFQAVATSLLIDAERAANPVKAEIDLKVALQYINEEKVIYPDHPLFNANNVDLRTAVTDGRGFLDKGAGLVYSTQYMYSANCDELLQRIGSGKVVVPQSDAVAGMLNRSGLNGQIWNSIAKKLGFSKEQADGVKMITQACTPSLPMIGRVYIWWGNDQHGPFSTYQDQEGQFERVRNDKRMGPGLWTLVAVPLK